MTGSISLVEVGPRDGLQNESTLVATADKVGLITRMINAGARRLEVGSFVNPRRVPQMADTPAVIAALPDRADVSYIGLCLNQKGVQRAAELPGQVTDQPLLGRAELTVRYPVGQAAHVRAIGQQRNAGGV